MFPAPINPILNGISISGPVFTCERYAQEAKKTITWNNIYNYSSKGRMIHWLAICLEFGHNKAICNSYNYIQTSDLYSFEKVQPVASGGLILLRLSLLSLLYLYRGQMLADTMVQLCSFHTATHPVSLWGRCTALCTFKNFQRIFTSDL